MMNRNFIQSTLSNDGFIKYTLKRFLDIIVIGLKSDIP